MSYILDALKKSEKAHQQRKSPSALHLEEIPGAVQPKRKMHWAYVIAGALLLNTAFMVWWLRPWNSGGSPEKKPEPAGQAVQTAQQQPSQKPVTGPSPAQPENRVQKGPPDARPSGVGRSQVARNQPGPADQAFRERQAAMEAAAKEGEARRQVQSGSAPQPSPPAPNNTREAIEAGSARTGNANAPVPHPSGPAALPEARKIPSSPPPVEAKNVPQTASESRSAAPVMQAAVMPNPAVSDDATGKSSEPPQRVSSRREKVPRTLAKPVRPQQLQGPQQNDPANRTDVAKAAPQPQPENPVQVSKSAGMSSAVAKAEMQASQAGKLANSRELISDLKSSGLENVPDKSNASRQAVRLYELPSPVRDALPRLSFSMLLYSKNADERRININGTRMREGQDVAPGLKLEEITPDGAVFNYQGHRFYKGVLGD